MFTEELTRIKKAEDEADSIRRDAKLEAKSLVEKANTQAGKILLEAEAKAKDAYDAFLRDGESQADKEQEKALRLALEEANSLGAQALKHQSDAIRFIKERTGKA